MSDLPPRAWPADPLAFAMEWRETGQSVALATVVGTWGSSPRPVGSVMAVCGDGRVEGSVSGGCVEGDIISVARDIMEDGMPVLRTYGVSNETAWGVGLACGGRLDVFVEGCVESGRGLPIGIVRRIVERGQRRESSLLVRRLDGAVHVLLERAGEAGQHGLPSDIARQAEELFGAERAIRIERGDDVWFVQGIAPPPRLLIVGAVHIAQALTRMAVLAGFTTAIIDPRSGLATPARFPGQTLVAEWPDEALETLVPDAGTAVVTLTHDPKLDDVALLCAANSQAFYIGALGSRATQAARLERLRTAGLSPAQIARIRGPVGLAIGAIGAEEIALSIMADIIAVRRGSALAGAAGW